jgi:hypothetical protein
MCQLRHKRVRSQFIPIHQSFMILLFDVLQYPKIRKRYTGCPRRKVSILGGHSIGHSKQKCMCTCVLFRTVSERELFHCTVPQLFDKKEMLRTVSNTGIYCSSGKVGTVYLL